MEQWTGSKLGKEYIKAAYCHSAYLTYMKSTSSEMLGRMKHKLESIFPGEKAITSDMLMITTLMAERGPAGLMWYNSRHAGEPRPDEI